jgi:hypothetical protein
MSGLQQGPQFSSGLSIYLETIKFLLAIGAGTVVADPLSRKAMVAGCILEAEEQGP